MAGPPRAEPCKLICGLIAAGRQIADAAVEALALRYGPIDASSPILPFTFTDYYRAEMGDALLRRFVAFAGLIEPSRLADIKRGTRAIEADFALRDGPQTRRRVNLDPGYVTPAKLVLATTKNFSHRICIGSGIFAEVTLNFTKSGIRCHPWTYPDFRSGAYTEFLLTVRRSVLEETAAAPPPSP